ncbi:MAG: class I poly(R)-hydroxyalkanoic acid synthase [Betaproteobacteria bacterium]|nr:class I poly(R)-hydroxyalkanoic acid synthase [Betaproteobacteria bacterium]
MSAATTPKAVKPANTPDPAQLAKSFARAAEKGSSLLGEFLQKQMESGKSMASDEFGIARAYMDLASKMLANPVKLAETQMNLWWEYMNLWQGSTLRMMGVQMSPSAIPDKNDRRFKHEDWQEHFLFDYIKQSYLIAARWMHKTVAEVEGLDPGTAKKVDFFTRQYIDALAPSNFALTNPEVLHETVRSGGENLVKGLHNLLGDIERGNGQLKISMTDSKAFELGVNIATTPGKVVFQDDLMQLIQYEPTTRKVFKRPLLIMPPWINKYYILDLREKNSMIKWSVDQGMTVFVISWVNPDAAMREKSFDDYLLEGPMAALDAIEKATGEKEVNAVGYCLGGTLLAAQLAYMAAKKDKRIVSATFMTALTDFRASGELNVFIDEKQIESLEKKMNERGYLEGSEMGATFNMLRANDLMWSFVINNYLLGRDPLPFDLLHWNGDSTRMPANMHSYYLRNMYLENRLREPGGITLDGVPIDLSLVKTPSYFVSALEDHIAPWKATYQGPRLFSGKSTFALSGSGHIAGMINPPSANKYCYWTNSKLPDSPDEWFDGAKQHEGSWWTDWRQWLDDKQGPQVAPRIPGKGKLKVLEPAPGSYAKLRLDPK